MPAFLIPQEEEARRAAERLQTVRGLCSAIGLDDDAAATAALTDFYALRTQIDWDLLIPPHIIGAARRRVQMAYEHMAGTTALGEARSAYAFIQRMTNPQLIPP